MVSFSGVEGCKQEWWRVASPPQASAQGICAPCPPLRSTTETTQYLWTTATSQFLHLSLGAYAHDVPNKLVFYKQTCTNPVFIPIRSAFQFPQSHCIIVQPTSERLASLNSKVYILQQKQGLIHHFSCIIIQEADTIFNADFFLGGGQVDHFSKKITDTLSYNTALRSKLRKSPVETSHPVAYRQLSDARLSLLPTQFPSLSDPPPFQCCANTSKYLLSLPGFHLAKAQISSPQPGKENSSWIGQDQEVSWLG